MKRYWRCLTYPLIGPPVGSFMFILTQFGYECATTDRCFLDFIFLPEIVVAIFWLGYFYGAIPAFVAGLVVSILRSVWSVTSMLAVFAVGVGVGLIPALFLISQTEYWNLIVAFAAPKMAAFLAVAGIAALVTEWASRWVLRSADARTEVAKA